MTDLVLDAWLTTPTGDLHLNDHVNYYIGEGSFVDQAVTHRRNEASSPFVDGTYIYNARRENVTETLEVYVLGATTYAKDHNLDVLKAALEQLHFSMVRIVEDAKTTWTCYASDYTSSTQRAFLHSRMTVLKSQVICDPHIATVEYP